MCDGGCYDCLYSPEEEQPSQRQATWMQSLTVYLLYVMQSSNGIPGLLYPILYERDGFSMDYQSFLQFGMLPWCFKFIPGWLFSNVFDPPRYLIVILHLILGVVTMAMAFVPIANAPGTIGIYFLQSVISIFHDVAFDAHVAKLYPDQPALPALIQLMGYLTLDVIVGFLGVGYLAEEMFVYIGVFVLIGIPYFWLIPWTPIPKESMTNIGVTLKENLWPFFIISIVWFTSSFGETLLGVFVSEMLDDDPHDTSIAFGIGQFASIIGSVLGNVLSANREMRWTLPLFLGVSAVVELTMIAGYYCRKVWCHSLVYSLTSIAAGASTMPCEIVSFYVASRASSPALMYSICNSIVYIFYTINGFVAPQAKKVMSWTGFLGLSSGMQIAGTAILALSNLWISEEIAKLKPKLWISRESDEPSQSIQSIKEEEPDSGPEVPETSPDSSYE